MNIDIPDNFNPEERYENNYIFVDTGFKRKKEPIYILALMEPLRRIKLNDENLSIPKFIRLFHRSINGKLEKQIKVENQLIRVRCQIEKR